MGLNLGTSGKLLDTQGPKVAGIAGQWATQLEIVNDLSGLNRKPDKVKKA